MLYLLVKTKESYELRSQSEEVVQDTPLTERQSRNVCSALCNLARQAWKMNLEIERQNLRGVNCPKEELDIFYGQYLFERA